jgi:hypothetical protein
MLAGLPLLVEHLPKSGLTHFTKWLRWPPLGIRGGVAEHVEEDGLSERVELGEGGAALGQ